MISIEDCAELAIRALEVYFKDEKERKITEQRGKDLQGQYFRPTKVSGGQSRA